MIRRPPRSTQSRSSAASDVYKRQAVFSNMCSSVREGTAIHNAFGDENPCKQREFTTWRGNPKVVRSSSGGRQEGRPSESVDGCARAGYEPPGEMGMS